MADSAPGMDPNLYMATIALAEAIGCLDAVAAADEIEREFDHVPVTAGSVRDMYRLLGQKRRVQLDRVMEQGSSDGVHREAGSCHGSALYWCPESQAIECPNHGGYDICCSKPERHMDPEALIQHLLSQ